LKLKWPAGVLRSVSVMFAVQIHETGLAIIPGITSACVDAFSRGFIKPSTA
jgi:hypothetical protein